MRIRDCFNERQLGKRLASDDLIYFEYFEETEDDKLKVDARFYRVITSELTIGATYELPETATPEEVEKAKKSSHQMIIREIYEPLQSALCRLRHAIEYRSKKEALNVLNGVLLEIGIEK